MTPLEKITKGSRVKGIDDGIVTIVSADWHGTAALEVTYKDSEGHPHNKLLYRDAEERIEIAEASSQWSFSGDARIMRLASEAYRIHLAHVFDPYLAVHTSSIEPLPHQISAVYGEMLPRLPLRFVLADDPGAGKTVMTGLFLKEMMVRGDFKRVLIVAPGSLVEQWQDEMMQRFHLKFDLLTGEAAQSAATGNVFEEKGLLIARLDMLARNEALIAKLRTTEWDFIVVDEAHKMSASAFGGDVHYTKRYQLGQLLSGITRHFLLLTATPHNGKNSDFYLFLSLIDRDRFEGKHRAPDMTIDVSDIMRRLVKEDLLRFNGKKLFPERVAHTVGYSLSAEESELYEAVTAYVREQFNRADNLTGERKNTVGFALTILQRRLASSPAAIHESLRRRRERLENRLEDESSGVVCSRIFGDELDDDDFSAEEMEQIEAEAADAASASMTAEELKAEIVALKHLEEMAAKLRASGHDRKWEELSGLLQDNPGMRSADGTRKKLIIFTEHRDTLIYLTDRLTTLLGRTDAVVNIHGAMQRDARREAESRFKQDSGALILVATDAAGEGINLQRAHLMVNYDLPWNPNRLEQRFGRIHRIGQTEICYMWNLVAKDTREGDVFTRLFSKLEEERRALGGKVFDVLGKVKFNDRSLRDLLVSAIRSGEDAAARGEIAEDAVNAALDREELRRLLEERALTSDMMDISAVARIREDMERMEAQKLQPHFIREFFLEAFKELGGSVRRVTREAGDRYEVSHVPSVMRNRDEQVSAGIPLLKRYERICFDKADCAASGLVPAELVCPGHALLDAAISAIRDRYRDALRQGAVFIDENAADDRARLLFYIEAAIADGTRTASGEQNVISRRVVFVELTEDGAAINAGSAPYLDYRAASEGELAHIMPWIAGQQWLSDGVEARAMEHAIDEVVPALYEQVRASRLELIGKISKAVKERMSDERDYWFRKSHDLRRNEESGKKDDKLNSQKAHARAEELVSRMERRIRELDRARDISALPPVIIGAALVIPRPLAARLSGEPFDPARFAADAAARKTVELAAMRAVMERERALGFAPEDVSAKNLGYDIESRVPDERRGDDDPILRFIEVKGRAKGADSVTLTKNEIVTAGNAPRNYILALVEVDQSAEPPKTSVIYIAGADLGTPGPASESVIFNIENLKKSGQVLYNDEED